MQRQFRSVGIPNRKENHRNQRDHNRCIRWRAEVQLAPAPWPQWRLGAIWETSAICSRLSRTQKSGGSARKHPFLGKWACPSSDLVNSASSKAGGERDFGQDRRYCGCEQQSVQAVHQRARDSVESRALSFLLNEISMILCAGSLRLLLSHLRLCLQPIV